VQVERLEPTPPTNLEVVENMNRAWAEGRFDEMLDVIHPNVEWRPITRPALSVYRGHDGTLKMLEDVSQVLGEFGVEWRGLTVVDDETVVARGLVTVGRVKMAFDAAYKLRDGLVVAMDSTIVEST